MTTEDGDELQRLARLATEAEEADPDELHLSRYAMERGLLVIGGRTEIVLVRHAQQVRTTVEALRPGGPPLSELGRAQARLTGRQLAAHGIQAAYASNLNRARETAAIIAETAAPGLEVVADERLREVDMFGRDRGTTEITPEVQRVAGEAFRRTLQWDAYPDTESGKELRERLHDVLVEIVTRHVGQRVLVVSHGGAISTFVAGVLKAEPDMFFFPGHASVSRVFHGDDRFVTHSLNEVAHLRDRGVLTF